MEVLGNDDDALVLKGILELENIFDSCQCIVSCIIHEYRLLGNSILNQIIPHDISLEKSLFPESSTDNNLLYTPSSVEIET